MAEAPPVRGSQEWIDFKRERIATLTQDERWPVVPSASDSTSANNVRHEGWLDEQEWPNASNEWLSRKGHPLTPASGERYRHDWLEVHQLRDVRLNGAVPRKAESEPIAPSPLSSTPSTGIDVGTRRAPHVIHSFQSEGLEAVEQEYERALSLAGGSERLVEETLARRRRLERSWQVAPGKPHRAAGRQEQELYDAYEEAARKWQESEWREEADRIRETLALRQRNAPPTVGYRPGSAKQRRDAGNRPPPWNAAPPYGRTQRW